jgi:hypothetical protein
VFQEALRQFRRSNFKWMWVLLKQMLSKETKQLRCRMKMMRTRSEVPFVSESLLKQSMVMMVRPSTLEG